MRNIVVLNKPGYKEDQSWACKDDAEAQRMVRWLESNGIRSFCISQTSWDNLPTYMEQPYGNP